MLGFKKKISQISDLTLKSKNEEVDKKSERSRFNPISKNINVFTPTKEYKNQDYIKKEDNIDYNSARQKQRKKEYIQERPISSCFSGFKKVNSLKQGENNQPITLAMNPYLKQRKKSSFDKVQPQKIPKSETLINLSLLLSDLDQSKIKQEHNKREDLKGQYSQKYEKSEQPQKNEIVSYIWRGNKQLLINKKITSFEMCLRSKIDKNQQLIESIRKKREKMDKLMENLIFNMMLNGQETQVNIPQRIQQQKGGKVSNPSRNGILMRNAVQEMRQMVNEVQLKSNLIGSDISDVLASELELYRMLIYKEKQKNGNTSSVDNNAEQQQKQN